MKLKLYGDYARQDSSEALKTLYSRQGEGGEYTGWLDLPDSPPDLDDIIATCSKLSEKADTLLVIGIGGSYLGAKAGLEYLYGTNYNEVHDKKVYFLGTSLSGSELSDVVKIIEKNDVAVNIISKSGTTLEPALAFRIILDYMKKKYPDDYKERIVATTDKERGTLKKLADSEGFKEYVVPDDVGGRYSVLTPVGLVPLCFAGADIKQIIAGAKRADEKLAIEYAEVRNGIHKHGKQTEVLVSFEPNLRMFTEWWKQLFGESEGKDGKGIFPANLIYTTDLHSMGQYVQDGNRNIFETVISFEEKFLDIEIPSSEVDDGLEYLAGKSFHYVNGKAKDGTIKAHLEGEVPVMEIVMEKMDEASLGELFYFFQKACGISGYMLGVNPFTQPGVEAYKKNMFALLDEKEN